MDKESMGEGYEKTKPWHPLYNIVIFTVFGFIYMNGLSNPTIAKHSLLEQYGFRFVLYSMFLVGLLSSIRGV